MKEDIRFVREVGAFALLFCVVSLAAVALVVAWARTVAAVAVWTWTL
jgi:hypothetical protein